MKKFTTITTALALTMLLSTVAFAMQGMDHGKMKNGDMSMHESMMVMEKNLQMMKKDVAAMKNADQRQDAMKSMNKHMTDMHHGMAGAEAHAKKNHDMAMESSMKKMNKHMMTTMKGMGLAKKNVDEGMPMMMEGLNNMEKVLESMKGSMK